MFFLLQSTLSAHHRVPHLSHLPPFIHNLHRTGELQHRDQLPSGSPTPTQREGKSTRPRPDLLLPAVQTTPSPRASATSGSVHLPPPTPGPSSRDRPLSVSLLRLPLPVGLESTFLSSSATRVPAQGTCKTSEDSCGSDLRSCTPEELKQGEGVDLQRSGATGDESPYPPQAPEWGCEGGWPGAGTVRRDERRRAPRCPTTGGGVGLRVKCA